MSLYNESCVEWFAAKRALVVHIKYELLLPALMGGLLVMASMLLHVHLFEFVSKPMGSKRDRKS